MCQVRGAVAGLLGELPGGPGDQRLAFYVAQSGGQLPQQVPRRVAVLPDEQHPVVVVERHHGDGAGMDHVVAVGVLVAGHPHGVGDDVR